MKTRYLILVPAFALAVATGLELSRGQGFGGGFGPVGGFGGGPIGGVGAIGGGGGMGMPVRGGGAVNLPWLPPGGGRPIPPGGHFPTPPGIIDPPVPGIPVHPGIGGGWYHGSWRWWWRQRNRRRWMRSRWGYRGGLQVYQNPFREIHVSKPLPPEVGSKAADEAAAKHFAAARKAFPKRDYTKAYREVAAALKLKPDDRAMLEFRALTHFARRKYKDAAADLHQVLSTGPGWDWPTMLGLYRDGKSYERHLRSLEEFRDKNPDNSEVRFVLSYHYLTEKHGQAAIAELTAYQKLSPGDSLGGDLLEAANAPEDEGGEEEAAPTLPESFDYHGTWTAESPGGGTLRLDLNKGAEFTLSYVGKDGAEDFRGDYALDGKRLLLEDPNEGPLMGSIEIKGNDEFVLKVQGDKKGDPGLRFKRSK
jgi:hypothetical protein